MKGTILPDGQKKGLFTDLSKFTNGSHRDR
jgi:hypothetical protein